MLFLALCFIIGLAFGSVSIPIGKIISVIGGESCYEAVIIKNLRLPRVLGAMFSGISLSCAGLLLQTVTDNDLCSPNVIGVNSGAGFGVMLVLCFAPSFYKLLPFAAFGGAFLATIIALGISQSGTNHSGRTKLVLSGIAVGTVFNSAIAFLSQKYPDVLSSYIYFSQGGFNGVYMKDIVLPIVLIAVGTVIAYSKCKQLTVLCIGDDMAVSLGVNVSKLRMLSLLLSSLLCAASVSYAGLLGFVGLIVPHIARRITSNNMRYLMPVTSIVGGIFVILADLLGRTLFAPAEISAGIILSMIGSPYFIYLLIKGRKRND